MEVRIESGKIDIYLVYLFKLAFQVARDGNRISHVNGLSYVQNGMFSFDDLSRDPTCQTKNMIEPPDTVIQNLRLWRIQKQTRRSISDEDIIYSRRNSTN